MDIEKELEAVRKKIALKKPKGRPSTSKLDKFKPEIITLKRNGASFEEIRVWLQSKKIECSRSTISRWWAKNG